jgi:hypothetical protein
VSINNIIQEKNERYLKWCNNHDRGGYMFFLTLQIHIAEVRYEHVGYKSLVCLARLVCFGRLVDLCMVTKVVQIWTDL